MVNAATKAGPKRRVLIVSPHFSPINAPDMQRVRMMLPYVRENGWEPVVLATDPALVEGGVHEPLLEKSYPSDIRVVRSGGIPANYTRWAHFGSLWWRCGASMRAAGERLLREERFDLVFFSTTFFDAFSLGPRWRRKFGVPYVLDYQDPWINDYYERTGTPPPGGRFKFGLSQWLARRREPDAVGAASGLIAVSGAYGDGLVRRYPWLDRSRVAVLPFATDRNDFRLAKQHQPEKPIIDFGDGMRHFVYAGRCGPDMSTSLGIIFRSFRKFLASNPGEARRTRFHFIGTDYAPPPRGREWAAPVARAEGVSEFVHEHCYRVPYFDCLHYLTHADGLLVVGSNDASYSASKLFPYVLSERPLLVVFHERSPVLRMAREMGCDQCFGFDQPEDLDSVSESVFRSWYMEGGMSRVPPADKERIIPHTAEVMTRQLTAYFDEAVRPS